MNPLETQMVRVLGAGLWSLTAHEATPSGRRGRRLIPVDRARMMYDQLGTWERVAAVLRCRDGIAYKPWSLWAAVRRADRQSR